MKFILGVLQNRGGFSFESFDTITSAFSSAYLGRLAYLIKAACAPAPTGFVASEPQI